MFPRFKKLYFSMKCAHLSRSTLSKGYWTMTLFIHYLEYCAWFEPVLWVWFLFLCTIFKLNMLLPHASRTICSPVLFSPSFISLNYSPIFFVIILPASHSSKFVNGTLAFWLRCSNVGCIKDYCKNNVLICTGLTSHCLALVWIWN